MVKTTSTFVSTNSFARAAYINIHIEFMRHACTKTTKTIPTFNTIQHTPTQQLSLRETPPSNVIQYMIGRSEYVSSSFNCNLNIKL